MPSSFWIALGRYFPQKHNSTSAHALRSSTVSLDNSLLACLRKSSGFLKIKRTIELWHLSQKSLRQTGQPWLRSAASNFLQIWVSFCMLYSRCILKIRPYCLDVFWFLENEKWQTADLTGSWNYSSSSSPCWEARSRLWDVVRDVQDFWTKIYQVLNSKKIPKTWNTSGYHNQYNRVDLVHHTSDLCS